jgi:alpha-D-ribose 1-methylphosphonate 5-triphosphate synthase subunit PhnL
LNLAHAMVKEPRLLLLDEPTASLDSGTKELVRALLLEMKGRGTSIIGIFHDLEFMEGVCDEVYNLNLGKLTA